MAAKLRIPRIYLVGLDFHIDLVDQWRLVPPCPVDGYLFEPPLRPSLGPEQLAVCEIS